MARLTNPTDLARETLKLMAARRIAPTPENFQRCYHEIAGTQPAADNGARAWVAEAVRQAAAAHPGLAPLGGLERSIENGDPAQFSAVLVALAGGRESAPKQEWGALLRDVLRGLEARQTGVSLARKKEGLERLLIHFSADPQLFEKLHNLVRAWAQTPELAATGIEVGSDLGSTEPQPADLHPGAAGRAPGTSTPAGGLTQLGELLAQTLELGVAARLERFPELTEEARALAQTARDAHGADAWTRFAAQLRRFFYKIEVRGESDAELLDALLRLLGLLVNNIGELVEDDQWLSGQVALVRAVINQPLTTERIAEAERRFKDVVYRQSLLKRSLGEAKATLKNLIALFVARLSEMTATAGEYHGKVEAYTGRLQRADDIATLKTIVDELLSDTRTMQMDVTRYHEDMVEARRQAEQAESRVRQLQAELEQVSEQVSHDQLTGMLNRRGLEDAMQREIARAERRKADLCVALLDLDNFKKLNDTYGHQAGDDALVYLAKIIRRTLRPTDVVARYGGEEFIILFSETGLDQAVEIMRRVQRELTRRIFLHNNERLLITFSAGVARLAPGESQETVFARADRAMYQAKIQGKNRVVSAD